MLKASLSLWSADLANLESEIRRSEPFADWYHLDVADGRYAPTLLFFPDLVKAIRPLTRIPFEVHLICERPEMWIEPFHDAGADRIIFYPDATEDPAGLVRSIEERGMRVGVSLALGQGLDLLEPYWESMDLAVVLGTDVGVKGVQAPAEEAHEKIAALVRERERRGLRFEIEADGAIRRETVPRLYSSGADLIVPGSLMFGADMREVKKWMAGLERV